MLETNCVHPAVLDNAVKLLSLSTLKDFYLVGGTSLALQIGHRLSVDIDLFSHNDFNTSTILEEIQNNFNFNLKKS